MSQPQPKGSGVYAVIWGAVFLVAALWCTLSGPVSADFLKSHPGAVIAAWLALGGVTLVLWGRQRLQSCDKNDRTVGQDTINFVMGFLAVTLALVSIYH